VATFYVLPPRAVLGDALARLLREFFPGLDWALAERDVLVDTLAARLTGRREVYVVFRDDLPAGEVLSRALVDGFGAEWGDEVVEVRLAAPAEVGSAGLTTRRWRVEGSRAA
jgi:hypothetical protein